MLGFVQMMFTEEYYVCCVWFGFLGEEGVGLNGEVLCGFELLAFFYCDKFILNKGTPLRSHAREKVCCSFIIQTRHVLKRRLLKKVFVFLGEVHRALCINIMPHSAPSIGISSALNFYIQGRGEVGERKCFQSHELTRR